MMIVQTALMNEQSNQFHSGAIRYTLHLALCYVVSAHVGLKILLPLAII